MIIYIPIFYFILLEIVGYLTYGMIHHFLKVNEEGKMVRDLLIVIVYVAYLLHAKILTLADVHFHLPWVMVAIAVLFPIILLLPVTDIRLHLYTVLQVLLFSPIVEELICRKFIFASMSTYNLIPAYFLSTAIFVIFHFSNRISEIIWLVFVSFVFCFIQSQTNSIINSIFLHFFCNCVLLFRSVRHS